MEEMNDDYKNNTSNERIVIDYISGMTDNKAIDTYNKIISF